MSQSDGEPAWQGKTYNASKDKKTLDWNKQGSNLGFLGSQMQPAGDGRNSTGT
jgi:hypothetical protein